MLLVNLLVTLMDITTTILIKVGVKQHVRQRSSNVHNISGVDTVENIPLGIAKYSAAEQ